MRDSSREILDALDFEFWCDHEGIDYRRTHGSSGAQLNIRTCPVCGGSDWKVYVNAETGLGNCFHGSCETKFNRWSFVKAHLGTETNRTVFDHIKSVVHAQGWQPKRTLIRPVDTTAVKLPMSFELPTADGRNLHYLEGRGIGAELARYFHLRYCQDDWWNFVKADGSRGGQRFVERVLIPVFDLEGALVTFQGRDITGTSDRKYLFPSGLPATGRFLYNGHNAKHAKRAVVGEGAFDVFALKKAIDEDPLLRDFAPVGTFGKHLSWGDAGGQDQLSQFAGLRRLGLQEAVMMWDGEKAALAAAVEAGMRLRTLGLKVRLALLPAGRDPNEVTGDVVRAAIYSAVTLTPTLAIQWKLRGPYR